jgi:hypothetical protein
VRLHIKKNKSIFHFCTLSRRKPPFYLFMKRFTQEIVFKDQGKTCPVLFTNVRDMIKRRSTFQVWIEKEFAKKLNKEKDFLFFTVSDCIQYKLWLNFALYYISSINIFYVVHNEFLWNCICIQCCYYSNYEANLLPIFQKRYVYTRELKHCMHTDKSIG